MDSELHILQHALGVGTYGDKRSHRNHFVTGEGSLDYPVCKTLVDKGLMQIRPMSKALTGGDDCFVVTPKGVDYVALNSPKRPPEPKLTRSQKTIGNTFELTATSRFVNGWASEKRRPPNEQTGCGSRRS